MKAKTDEAVVLGLMDYREADVIVTLFCREYGKLAAVAKGARNSRRRFGGALELFARLQVSLDVRENLSALIEADAVTVYPGIRKELSSIAHACYACELASAYLPEHHPNSRLFRLLGAYLNFLDSHAATPSGRHFFEVNLLNILGYCPPLHRCQQCGAVLAEYGGFLSSDAGFCRRCFKGAAAFELSASAITGLLQSLGTGQFGAVRFTGEECQEVESFLEACIASNLQKPLKSLSFLRLSP